MVEGYPADGPVLYLVVIQRPGCGRARRPQETEDEVVVGGFTQTLFVDAESGERVERGRGRQERGRDRLQEGERDGRKLLVGA